jgi:hypothetical protein
MSEAKEVLDGFTTALRHRDDLVVWLREAEIEFETIPDKEATDAVGITIDGELWIVHFDHDTGNFKKMVWS